MSALAVFVLFLAIVPVPGKVFRGHNYAHDTRAMFKETYNKFHMNSGGIEALSKRATKKEMAERLANFRKSVEIVDDVNDNPALTYRATLTFMTVMTNDEISNMLNLDKINISKWEAEAEIGTGWGSSKTLKQQKVVNWVSRGALPAVKNQGGCGSCWAFSATTAMEGNYFIETGDKVSFSDQESLDCAAERVNRAHDGCRGGWMGWPYDYVKAADRLALEKDYQYVAKDRPCNMNGKPNGLKKAFIKSWEQLPQSDSSLLEAAAKFVVSVGIQVGGTKFSYYSDGIYTCKKDQGCNCQVRGDHAVDLVGYGEGFWRVRNSWGSQWGEGGYIRMSRAQENICLINTAATIPKFECRRGQKCKKWDGDDKDEEEEEEEEEKEDDEFDVGKPVKCGPIKHYGGRCVDLGKCNTCSGTKLEAILTDIGCDRQFCLTDKGYIQDKATKKCLTASDPNRNNYIVTFNACKDAYKWSETSKGFKIQASSGKCWHPYGGSANPKNECKVCIYSGCNEDRLTFKITESLCWEEISGKKLGKKLKDSKGKPRKVKKVDDAKDLCLETDGCKGLYLSKGKYFLSGSDKPLDSKKKGDKIFVITDCSKACEVGEQRCEDGECKEKCDKDDDDCPPGTTRCPDGICKHIHMC